jgi:hypothetical protein
VANAEEGTGGSRKPGMLKERRKELIQGTQT